MLRQRLNCVLGLMILLACASRVSAGPITVPSVTGGQDLQFCDPAKLLADDLAAGDLFGNSMSVSGDVALVGAPNNDENGSDAGSAYVFRWNGIAWVQEQKLLPNDGDGGDEFGHSVSVSGNVALIGAWLDDDNGPDSGSTYVFRWNGIAWVQEQKLVPVDGAAGDRFGSSVSVSANVALVGASEDDDFIVSSGSAYTFRWNGAAWVQEQKLLPSDGAAFDVFGNSVSVSGDVALIGANNNDDNGSDSGSAYVFRWNGAAWVQEQKLLPSDGAAFDLFGFPVSVSGDVALIGAIRDSDNGVDSGSAYVFRWNGTTWLQEQKLLPNDGEAFDKFGFSVSVSADIALIGAVDDNDNGANSGSAYVFERMGTNWIQTQKLLPNDGSANDWFGFSVSVSANVALVGAPQDDDNGLNSGSAYFFSSAVGPDCNLNGVPDRCDIANGTSLDLDRDGIPDICADFCELRTILAGDGSAGDGFGFPVFVEGELALVGASGDDDNGLDSGAAYMFRWNGMAWVQEQKLLPNDGVAGDGFGRAASLSGDVAVVGAVGDDDNGTLSGSAYVFRWNGAVWIQEQKLMPNDGDRGQIFGGSLSVYGDVAVVGAPWDDDNGRRSGSAYVFRWNGAAWVQEQKLLPDDGTAFTEFGSSVSVSGNVALVGRKFDNSNGDVSGSAYMFRWNGTAWVQEQKLLPSDGATGDWFGCSVSMYDDVALIGATLDNDNGVDSGSAYVFRWNGAAWTQEKKLLADDGVSGDSFGSSVSVYGDVAVVGAPHHFDNGTAYVFRWNGTAWIQKQKLLANGGAAFDGFGDSVSVWSDVAVVGADFDDDNGKDSGSSRAFSIGVTDCNQNNVFDACDIGAGTSDDCNNNGILDGCEVPQDCVTTGTCPVMSTWVGNSGLWDDPADNLNWCLSETPNNNPNATFNVTIDGSTAAVTLNTSPTIAALSLQNGATIVVGDRSGANVRTLASDGPINNTGIFRATDRERLVLDAPTIDQGGVCGSGGVLEAADGVFNDPAGPDILGDKSVLEINGGVVLGGTARTIGNNSEIHLIGGAELVDVCVDGVVVPDGQTGSFGGTLNNNDVLTIRGITSDTKLGPATPNAVLASSSGTGCVRLTSQAHAQLGDFFDSFTNSANHRIDGAGLVFGGVTNIGVIEANGAAGEALILSAPGTKTNAGILGATGSGMLQLIDNVTQSDTGIIKATAGGVVEINADVSGTGGMVAKGGTVRLGNVTVFLNRCTDVPPPLAGSFASRIEVVGSMLSASGQAGPNDLTISGGMVAASALSTVIFSGPVTICPQPSFQAILDLAQSTFTAGTLDVCQGGMLSLVDSTLTVRDSFTFHNTAESDHSLIGTSSLEMTGGVGLPDGDSAGYASLEIGGEDFGTDPANHIGDPAGFVGNFALPKLMVGSGSHVSIFDRIDNANRIDHGFGTDEALYVDTLVFTDGTGRLNVNGLHLYVGTLLGNLAQIVDLPRAPGDFDADGDQDLRDFAHLQGCFGDAPPDHGCRVFDFDANAAIDLLDTRDFSTVMGGPG